MAKLLIMIGVFFVGAGILLLLSGKAPWIGSLPGDIMIRKEGFSFYFPLTTCILISLVLSLVFWIIRK